MCRPFALTLAAALALLVVDAAAAEPPTSPQAGQLLDQARTALRSPNKDIEAARNALNDLAGNHAASMSPTDLCYVYVYLGYIEDLAGNRAAAVAWFEKAQQLDGPNIQWIRQVAEAGMTKPVTWIRHLDEENGRRNTSSQQGDIIERIGGGYVTRTQPANAPAPRMNLSAEERLESFDILWQAIDRTFSFFQHKDIDWDEVRERYRPQVEAVNTDEEFYAILERLVRELKDCHSWLCNWKPGTGLSRNSPGVSTALIEGKAVVTHVDANSEAYAQGLRPGWEIVEVDGLTVPDTIEQLRPALGMSSSERNFLDTAYRRLLDGERGTTVSLKAVPLNGDAPVTLQLRRLAFSEAPRLEPGFPIEKGPFILHGIHPSGYGYIRILSFDGRVEIADAFDRALESLKDTPALVVDIRDNKGGFGTAHPRIVGRFLKTETTVAVSYIKNGPEHDNFRKHESRFGPAGPWQYTKPVSLLMNVQTGSAADLFACYMASTGRVTTVGTTTHGNLTGVGVYVVLPCGLVVRVSSGYVCDASGRTIEGNGNVPEVLAERTTADVVNGTDSVLDCAVQTLRQRLADSKAAL